MIVRRERPHPGAQLDAFEEADGWRYTAFATTPRSATRGARRPAPRGDGGMEALRVLKRRLSDVVYHRLIADLAQATKTAT